MMIKIWKERNKIMEGVKNNVFKKEHVEQIAAERNQLCITCDRIDHSGKKCAIPGTAPCCSECGCSLKFKQRSLSSDCPLGYWKAVVSESEEDMIKYSIEKNQH